LIITDLFFNLHPVNFLIISGLIQNFILAGILFFRPGESQLANRILSFTIVIVNLHLTYLMVLDTNLDNFFPVLLWIPYSFLTALGPLILLYTKALTRTDFRLSDINLKHFIPLCLEIAVQVIMIIQAVNDDRLLYNTSLYFYAIPILYLWTACSIFYYIKQSVQIINSHETWALKTFSNLKEITLNWLKKLIRYYRILWLVWSPFVALFLVFFRFQLMYLSLVVALYLLILILTYLTLWIGIEGLGRGTLVFAKHDDGVTENKNFSKLTSEEVQAYEQRITQLMARERMFLNENLNLRELAAALKADPNLISFVLNNHMATNFHDFVNRYRIDEVKSKLATSGYEHLTLLGIALESGFNSKTTFNRVFKQVTGLTPSEFLKIQGK